MGEEGWVFLVENTDAVDPMEVIYRLAKVDMGTGEIIERDGYLTGCGSFALERASVALKNDIFTKETVVPACEATHKAVRLS